MCREVALQIGENLPQAPLCAFTITKPSAFSNLFPEHPFNQAITTFSFVRPTLMQSLQPKLSIHCFNVAESSCANKQGITVNREESLTGDNPTCAFYLINPTQRHFAGPRKGLINCV